MINTAPTKSNNDIVSGRFPVSIPEIESKMLELPQAECPVIHRFGPGVYMREVTIPAGVFAIGHYQKKEHVNIFLKGRVIMLDPDTGMTSELVAPMIFTGQPGRKMGYIKEEVVWLNVYATDETDIETLERTFLDKSPEWQNFAASKAKQAKKRTDDDIEDYKKVLREFGISEHTARKQSENKEDQIPMPFGSYKFAIADSLIEGRGVFATSRIEPGEIIGPAKIGEMRTPLGRYTNHAKTPNAKMVQQQSGDIYLVATTVINGCAGGFLGDEITTDYRLNLQLMGRLRICQE